MSSENEWGCLHKWNSRCESKMYLLTQIQSGRKSYKMKLKHRKHNMFGFLAVWNDFPDLNHWESSSTNCLMMLAFHTRLLIWQGMRLPTFVDANNLNYNTQHNKYLLTQIFQIATLNINDIAPTFLDFWQMIPHEIESAKHGDAYFSAVYGFYEISDCCSRTLCENQEPVCNYSSVYSLI